MLCLTPQRMGLPHGSLEIEVEERFDETVVRARGEIDMATIASLETVLHRVSRLDAPVRLDLSEVEFVDSSGIHAVDSARSAANRLGRTLEVGPVSDAVARVFAFASTDGTQPLAARLN